MHRGQHRTEGVQRTETPVSAGVMCSTDPLGPVSPPVPINQSCVHARGDNRARPVCVKCTVHDPDYRRTPSLASIQDASHPNLTFFDPTYRKENINVRPDHHWRVPPNQLCPNSSLFW